MRTLIIVRRILTEPNTAWAGGKLPQASLARSRALIATFSEERIFSCRFCCLELFNASMVEGRGSYENTVTHRLCGRIRILIQLGGYFVIAVYEVPRTNSAI